jgi:hypothetical protein
VEISEKLCNKKLENESFLRSFVKMHPEPGKPILRAKLNTVDLLVQTSLDQLLLILLTLFAFLQNKLP